METQPLSLEEALSEYKTIYLPAKNLAEKTRRFYNDDLRQLLKFLALRGVTTTGQLDLRQLNTFLADLDTKKLSGYTRRRKVSSIKSFCGFLAQSKYMPNNPSEQLIPPKRESKTPRFLSESEYKRLQLAVANQPMYAALVEILLQTGVRLSELANLYITDIDLPQKISKEAEHVGTVLIRRGKGRKDRVIALNYKACRAIKSYLAIRPRDTGHPHLFLSKFKRPITPRGIEWIVNKYLAEAEIERASVHTLRHTFGTHQVKAGTSLRTVKEMMGHESLATTDLYVGLARDLMNKEMQEHAL